MIERDIEPVHEDLVRSGAVLPVEFGGAEERAWLDCDLASFAENRLDDHIDPRDLDDARRAEWLSRAVDERPPPLARRSRYARSYWLSHDGQRAGTLALATSTMGGASLYLSSFYVLPPFRRRGVGRSAMRRVQEVLAKHDLGLRLDTSWCWQRAVRFYVDLGLWVYMWKRDLTLYWAPRTPPPRIEVGDGTASLSVRVGDTQVTLARARRQGDVLEFEEPKSTFEQEEGIEDAYWHATSTLSLSLAIRGWPLIRSREEWERSYYADGGPPEALAYKISIWEAWAKKQGWVVLTPRIPGLVYPTWGEFERRWEAAEREIVCVRPEEP